jgi:hypothetical protein
MRNQSTKKIRIGAAAVIYRFRDNILLVALIVLLFAAFAILLWIDAPK